MEGLPFVYIHDIPSSTEYDYVRFCGEDMIIAHQAIYQSNSSISSSISSSLILLYTPINWSTVPVMAILKKKNHSYKLSLALSQRSPPYRYTWVKILILLSGTALCLNIYAEQIFGFIYLFHNEPPSLQSFQECSIRNMLSTGLYFLEDVSPPTVENFESRRNRLAHALVADGVDAFVLEPGYTFKYYANISQEDWEPWEPEERPFLMVVQSYHDPQTGIITANTSFLCPSFEAERARLLLMPFSEPINIIPWEEHWNPYKTLFKSEIFARNERPPRLMVDEEMRDYIQRGLAGIGFEVVGLQKQVEMVRQMKSKEEIDILRAVNTGTVEAIRQIRKCLYPGLTELDIQRVLDNTLRAVGLEPFFDIVLFDENASNPHGGTNSSKVLDAETFVLIDVGAHLYGYSSDITRAFFPPFLDKPQSKEDTPACLKKKIEVWNIVFAAQSQSFEQLHANATAASVDIAARTVIEAAGYGHAFTHRIGHGIGIKAHESPYMNKANYKSILQPGMAFTSEPGIYLVNEFGVRVEDVVLVNGEDEEPTLLTGQRAQGPWDP
ncbi:xaa-pro dipeptidase app, putative [Talaromyces stipitatus ATCC 10500]|uniref:Xaa-pro dipeptidase app, putative n=1 Tax=Talaromyces stipitatus (strain ATCC 10500 / CBS 375.48 / QM 6759 / NRRL 1006) TaxID=441959 RepID=B8LSS1_TALSN|nr:xaa-pro dipeptidase app, putative [Talaromyces stipitatus ATCC 10500]EED22917.1 xaa-pro dipeptidase app, putative [Talaromyces stipitatus ATCC 10500]